MNHSTPEYFPVLGWDDHGDGLVIFEVQSSESPLVTYSPAVDFSVGTVDCDCPHFENHIAPPHRRADTRPHLNKPRDQCKHIWDAVNAFLRDTIKKEMDNISHEQNNIPRSTEANRD